MDKDQDRLSEQDLDEAAGGYGAESGEEVGSADSDSSSNDPATRSASGGSSSTSDPED